MCDDGPGCGDMRPGERDCAVVCVCAAGRLVLASLEVEGAESGSPVGTTEGALL